MAYRQVIFRVVRNVLEDPGGIFCSHSPLADDSIRGDVALRVYLVLQVQKRLVILIFASATSRKRLLQHPPNSAQEGPSTKAAINEMT